MQKHTLITKQQDEYKQYQHRIQLARSDLYASKVGSNVIKRRQFSYVSPVLVDKLSLHDKEMEAKIKEELENLRTEYKTTFPNRRLDATDLYAEWVVSILFEYFGKNKKGF